MYLKLIRNKANGSAITGRLVIDGHYFCDTLERVGYQIPALCYHVSVTHSPKFKRLLPLVHNVPRAPIGGTPSNSEASNRAKPVQYPAAECRTGIRFHRGSKPEHSTGCILVLADRTSVPSCPSGPSGTSGTPGSTGIPGSRTSAEVENELTQLLLKAQNAHEEIILEVFDFTPGTEYGYNTPCPPHSSHHDTVVLRDTIHRHDSVIYRERTVHDTVYITKEVYRDTHNSSLIARNSAQADTVRVVEYRDCVIEHPPEKYIPKFYKWCTGLLFAILVLAIGYWLLTRKLAA